MGLKPGSNLSSRTLHTEATAPRIGETLIPEDALAMMAVLGGIKFSSYRPRVVF